MVNIVLASHGPLAEAMIQSSQMLFGKSEYVTSVCLNVEDRVEDFAKALKEAIEPHQEVLLLVDIPGGTPSNQGMLLLNEFANLRVVSGMNLMMLLECLIRLETSTLEELKEIALKSGMESIREMRMPVKQDEDDLDALLND